MTKKAKSKPKPPPAEDEEMSDAELEAALRACDDLLHFLQNASEEQIDKWRS